MPAISRWMIRAAMLYLLVAMAMAIVSAATPRGAALRATQFHLVTVGWATQLIFGVIYWMFPKVSRERPRGNETLMASGAIMLNLGILLRLIAEPAASVGTMGWVGPLLAASAIAQLVAVAALVAASWPRVRGKG